MTSNFKLNRALINAKLTPGTAMDILQDHGIVSDNAIHIEDVATTDIPNAIRFIESQ